MVTIRVHPNPSGEGTLWWADGDMGFYGGADTLPELLDKAREWAEDEQLDLEFELVPDSSHETGSPTRGDPPRYTAESGGQEVDEPLPPVRGPEVARTRTVTVPAGTVA
ncbi:MAG: hypothetical protein OXG69_15205 [bacterium]|nr:hypothetical protein [bacterium]